MKKSNIWIIAQKELARFFGDKRMVITTLVLPGVLIYALYSFMGGAINKMLTVSDDYTTTVYAENLPESVAKLSGGLNFDITPVSSAQGLADAKAAIAAKDLDLLVIFSENFDAEVAAYDSASGQKAPYVEIYYNSTRTESAAAHGVLVAVLDAYESSLANKFDVNPGAAGFDLASERDTAGFMFSSMLPMLLMIFLFSGCMAIGPESIAGEKERGTIATVLITPMKRSEFAAGKIISLALIALLSGAASAVGTLLSMPKLMGGAEEGMSAAFYSISDYLMLAAVILSTVLVFISLISVISAYAKSVKEATTAVMPLMILSMLVGITAMLSPNAQTDFYYYLIPLYNSVQSMAAIFAFGAQGMNILVTVLTNLAVTLAATLALTKMFSSEKCMFNK